MLIAIPLRVEKFGNQDKWFINDVYIKALEKLNVTVFPLTSYSSIEVAKNICDGLILPGGLDINPFYFNQSHDDSTTLYNYPIDLYEFKCLEAFYHLQKPILGICRGMQIINVFFNGTILQDINTNKHALNNQHPINIRKNSFLQSCYSDSYIVNSYHHQVIGKLGKDLISSAYSDEQYIEAIEHTSLPIYGVQWHPELEDNSLVLAFFMHVISIQQESNQEKSKYK